ncbi:MAG: LL-diaminopimelate aminotransferase [Firmicutes bacterium]|nr:LL-diaminopimelate aminotransferase [Bacillota bacterium]
MKINQNYLSLNDSYLFSSIAQKVRDYKAANPNKEVISLGIGDVTRPLAAAVVQAIQEAATEMGQKDTFRGYGEEQGYHFLRQAVAEYYAKKGVTLDADEVFISDGAKSDLANVLDIFAGGQTVLIPNPVYPVYHDTNVMVGNRIVYTDGTEKNGFLPMPDPQITPDIIYLCSPNNPTGAVYSKSQLQEWVNYALKAGAVILFDAAYEVFIRDKDLPSSIYQINGAKECAIEICSLSKTAGFTGTRCGYTVVPKSLVRSGAQLNKLWLRRQTTKFNGVSYIIQKGAAAVFTQEGQAQTRSDITYYANNAAVITKTLNKKGIWSTGGINSPYVWFKCPDGYSSWQFFDKLLNEANVVGTPGAGFGSGGEGFMRFTAFGNAEKTLQAMKNFEKLF